MRLALVMMGREMLEKVMVGVDGMELATEDSVEDTAVVVVGVEQTGAVVLLSGGKTAPLLRGRGRVGLAALPTGIPTPGNLGGLAAGAATLAAWCRAALSLSL